MREMLLSGETSPGCLEQGVCWVLLLKPVGGNYYFCGSCTLLY